MNDKIIKWLLAGIVLLLGANLWQLGFGLKPAQAQSVNRSAVPSAMTTDKGLLYILRGNQLSVYYMDNTMLEAVALNPSQALQVIAGEGKEKMLKSYKLRKVLTADVSR